MSATQQILIAQKRVQLLLGLISYWKLDEASGNAVDSHGSNTLTDNNTATVITGKIGNARDLNWSAGEHFSLADNASLSTGDIDFTFSVWHRVDSVGGTQMIIAKDTSGGGNREYIVIFNASSGRFAFGAYTATDSETLVDATSTGSLSLGTWYFIVAWYSASLDTMYIQVNNGTVHTASKGPLQASGNATFMLGRRQYPGFPDQLDGVIDEVGFWKRVLSSQEREALYNAGNGLAYSSFT